MSGILIKKTESIFDEPNLVKMSKTNFVNNLKTIVDNGGEISWLTTDTKSFDWAAINSDVKKFLNELMKIRFETVSVGIFHPKTKKTEYTSYQIV